MRKCQFIVVMIIFLQLAICVPLVSSEEKPTRQFGILAFNDVYHIEGVEGGQRGGLARLRSLRLELEKHYPGLLLLHAGDLLFPSLLSDISGGGHMIRVLNQLDGKPNQKDEKMFVTFGNHEFDRDKMEHATNLNTQISNSEFTWLGSNLAFVAGEEGNPVIRAPNLARSKIVHVNGIRVGLFGLTTDIKDPEYLSILKFMPVAEKLTTQLRKEGAEVVIAITHLSLSEDKKILEELQGDRGPDIILGGHEHDRKEEKVNGRWVLKSDADLRTATVVTVKLPEKGGPLVSHKFRFLESQRPVPDPQVLGLVKQLLAEHDQEFCQTRHSLPPGCLETPLGNTQVDLIAEELKIRQYETNLGNHVADLALAAYSKNGAQAAFINSGAMRLNQNIPKGSSITRRLLYELFPYSTHLKMLRIKGETLQKVISRSIRDWTGNGHWLQISGFAFRHNPDEEIADQLTLLTGDGPRLVKPNEELLVVTTEFLFDSKLGNQDGYTMLNTNQIAGKGKDPVFDLAKLVEEDLAKHGDSGIAPKVEGRICNTRYQDKPCLVADAGVFSIDRLSKGIEGIANYILDYALILAAAGTVVMALLELFKKLLKGRELFHEYRIFRWFRRFEEKDETLMEEFYLLACGGKQNSSVLYDQPTDKMMGQIQSAANLALDFPNVYAKFFAFLTEGSTEVANKTDQAQWKAFSEKVSARGVSSADKAETRLSTQARSRLGNLVTRKLDALQSEIEYRWAKFNQMLAVGSGTLLMHYLLTSGGELDNVNPVLLWTLSVLSGLVAPFAKDVVTALTGLKTKR